MIKNISKNTIVSGDFSYASGFEKFTGLINSPKDTLIFKTRFGIHTFFLKNPIDVIVLDKNKKAVIIKTGLKPNRIFFWSLKYNTVLELPENSVQKSKTEKNDKLKIS